MKAYVSAYRYDGPHRNWNPRTGRIERDHIHWDWRYKIKTKTGVTILHRQGFHHYENALESLCRQWPRLIFAMKQEGL